MCQPVSSSRVPARGGRAIECQPGESFSCKMPAKGAVRVQWQRTEPGGGERKDRERASHSRQMGHSKGIWDDDETRTRLWCY